MVLRARPIIAVVFGICCPALCGQAPFNAVARLTVMIPDARNPGGRASGIVIGDDKVNIYVATVAHAVGPSSSSVSVEFVNKFRFPQLKCEVLAAAMPPDIAVLKCKKLNGAYRFSYDVAGEPKEARPGSHLTLIGNFGDRAEWKLPLGYFILKAVAVERNAATKNDIARNIEYVNPLHLDLEGSSGGPFLTRRFELLGLQINQKGDLGEAVAWPYARKWIEDQRLAIRIRLSRRARTAPALHTGNVEFSAAWTSIHVPNFGWLTPVPKFHLAAAMPNLPNTNLAFDFTFTQSTKEQNGFEKLSLVIPAVTVEYQLGSLLGILRRRELLGGFYVGTGIAPLFWKDMLQKGQQQSNNLAWTQVFDAGWRYRLPGRGWGFTGSYREGVLFGDTAKALYPRFRSVTCGLFVIFR